MALLNRLFSSRKKNHKQGYVSYIKNEYESWKPFNFSKEQVRVLLFRECDWRGRKLLFDSKAVQRTALENQPCSKLKFGPRQKCENKKTDAFVEVTNGFGYQYTRPNPDVTMLGEMIFGSVAMSFQGSVSKVHSIKGPSRLMYTKVFHSPGTGTRSRGASDRSLEDSCGSSINSMSEYFAFQGSSSNSRQVDSGFCGDASLQSASSVGSTCGFGTHKSSPDSRRSSGSFLTSHNSYHSGGSLASLQRRWLRNMSTSLELGSSWSMRNSVNEDDVTVHTHRRTKLGLAVIINLSQEEEKLWLVDVLCTPRLTSPVWLGLTCGMNHLNSSLSYNFLQDLCQLIATFDTKATNFFVSTLVTAVLTHHLGWVATILPGKMPPQFITKKPCTGQLLDALSKSHPYNPLWAQLGELYGALGFPTKIAKTIVTSGIKRIELLNKILSSLTYFIRCSEVEKRVVSDKVPQSKGSASTSTLINEDAHPSFSRTFLSGHDVMQVFENRVDPGVEIGRELRVDSCPDTRQSSGSNSTLQQTSGMSVSEHDLRKEVPPTGGLRRTTSCAKKLDNAPKNERLYPSLADLQLIEDETQELKSEFRPDDISKKVNRLMRVPTNAIMYHLQGQDIDAEMQFQPKRIESERQRSAPLCRTSKWTEAPNGEKCNSFNSPQPLKESNEHSESLQEGVVFVLGDNEKLVGLKSVGKCESDVSELNKQNSAESKTKDSEETVDFNFSSQSCIFNGVQHSIPENSDEPSDVNNEKCNLYSDDCVHESEVTVTGQCIKNHRPSCRIVTVRPSVIELEDECGGLKTDVCMDVSPNKAVTRSLSFPLSENCNKNKSLCRRHSECVCKTSFCSKAYRSLHFQDKERVLINDSEGRDHLGKRLDNVTEVTYSVSDSTCGNSKDGCVSEDNAIFEVSSDLSDDDALFDRTCRGKENNEEPSAHQSCDPIMEVPIPQEVQLVSSHTYVVDKPGTLGVRVGMSRLVANMLESLLYLWKLKTSPEHYCFCLQARELIYYSAKMSSQKLKRLTLNEKVEIINVYEKEKDEDEDEDDKTEPDYPPVLSKQAVEECVLHLESKLRELFLRSQALAELLLTTEFCDMELLTTSLDLDANDVPLLLAIAATHTPQVAERYGLSFR
ncbi:hypothetical protein C0J52_14352 [Blattella germanica]|nr:hypothetical protein C0J52_14352 [Blattella germanica]